MSFAENSLLPAGLHDDLPEVARRRLECTLTLLSGFQRAGYRLVNPPLLEFSTGNLPGVLQAMDPLSQTMLTLRPDQTPQVARIATTRLADHPRPLRLCYAGEVVRASGTALRPERQFTQVGLEMIGCDVATAETEVILLAAEALHRIGIESITIDLCLPALPRLLLENADLPAAEAEAALDALRRKDANAIAALPLEIARPLGFLPTHVGGLAANLPAISAYPWPSAVESLLRPFLATADCLLTLPLRPILTLDLTEQQGFSYHIGLGFSVFASGFRGEIGRGGRYRAGSANEPAIGFSFTLDPLLPSLQKTREPGLLLVPFPLEAQVREALLQEWRLLYHHASGAPNAEEALRLECQGFYDAACKQVRGCAGKI